MCSWTDIVKQLTNILDIQSYKSM